MTWIKDINGKWYRPNNDIKLLDFKQNIKQTNETVRPQVSTIYIPTHNINDVYEWYRIFQDSYAFSNNFDKNGFAIHAYFDKNRGESIKGWFPNLIEVKASSTDEIVYNTTGGSYTKHSKDYITVFTVNDLHIDDVKIYDGEYVLLKNQNFSTLNFYSVDSSLSNGNKYYVLISSGDEQNFGIGNTLIIKDALTNTYTEDKILHINFTTIGLNSYAVIKTQNPVQTGTIQVADREKGLWTYTSLDQYNGVYEYVNNQLTPLPLMFDKYKTYNQIVYTYQGDTNMNKQFYLRRIENKLSSKYSQYPVMNYSDYLIYSEGEAALIKAEIDYSLNVDNSSTLDLISLSTCCECIANINLDVPDHPTGPPPYDIDTDAFRLLFLDSKVGEKVFTTNIKGIGDYQLTPNPIDAQAADVNFIFYPFDANALSNAIQAYVDDKFFNYPGAFNYDFIYQPLNPGETYSVSFNTASNTIILNDSPVFSTLTCVYDGSQEILPTSVSTLRPGDFINIRMEFTIDGESYTALDDQFLILNNNVNDGVTVGLDIYPPLGPNFINEFELANAAPNDVVVFIDVFHTYGTNGGNIDDNMLALQNSINSTIFGKLYDFIFTNDGTTVSINFNGIRQTHKYKWFNHGMTIECNSTIYELEHTINKNYRPYFYGYNIEDYLTQYLGLTTASFPQLVPFTIQYYNIAGASNRFGIEGSNKTPGKGNIIYFGESHKEVMLDNIKRNTLLKLTNFNTLLVEDNIWVSDIYWDEEQNLGTIVTLNEIDIPSTNDMIYFQPINELTDISTKLKTIMDKDLNTVDNPSFATYKAYKPDTASYAFAMMNYGYNAISDVDTSLLNNITALVYKEYNEPRISFLKRDRKFKFDNDERINVHVASDLNDVDVLSAPASIDGYVLNMNDLIVLKDQLNFTENGVYIFNGVGNPLTRYTNFNRTNYWIAQNGTLNTGKSFQAYYELPLVYGTTQIYFVNKYYKTKKDDRLTIKPVAIAKLGVDNETQPWIKINAKYDTSETEENVVTIQPGINSINQIRFIDGLTEYNILNDINGQGQYSWILGENVLTENAVVGCTQDNGPGTGTLIWYTGTWVEGTWCNGIWIQGTWESGIWVNGTRYAYPIQDFYYYVSYSPVTNHLLSPWLAGTWLNGTWNGGIATDILWYNGTFNDGTIIDGRWYNGTFNKGIIKHIIWDGGLFTGGDFETGIWKAGTLNEASPANPARFGIGANSGSVQYKDRAIWLSGTFKLGEFHSGDNTTHNGSIFYSGFMENADFYGGSFVMGVFKNGTWHNGVWFGGYTVSMTDVSGDDKELTFTPDEYDDVLGLTILSGYIANSAHRIHTYSSSFYLLATPVIPNAFTVDAFLNVRESVYNTSYVPKTVVSGTETDTTITLNVSSNPSGFTMYVVGNPILNQVPGYPFVCAEFSGTWKAGTWLNGYFKLGTWETGAFINGYADNAVFGLN